MPADTGVSSIQQHRFDVCAQKIRLLLFMILLMVASCSGTGDKLLFTVNIYVFVHSMMGSNAEWYGDSVSPTLS